MVEHIVHIDGVTGSSPVATTTIPGRKAWDSSLSPGFKSRFPWIFPDLPCTACMACNPCTDR